MYSCIFLKSNLYTFCILYLMFTLSITDNHVVRMVYIVCVYTIYIYSMYYILYIVYIIYRVGILFNRKYLITFTFLKTNVIKEKIIQIKSSNLQLNCS